ncbi:MAG TPA: GspMb/PilO family protein [Bacillota bacterium]
MKKQQTPCRKQDDKEKSRWPLLVIGLSLPVILWRYAGPARDRLFSEKQQQPPVLSTAVEVANLQNEVRRWEAGLFTGPVDHVLGEIMTISLELADLSGVVIKEKRMHPRLTAPKGWQRVGMTLTGEGAFQELVDFLKLLTFHEKYLAVDRLQVHTRTGRKPRGEEAAFEEPKLHFELVISTWQAAKDTSIVK